MSRWSIMRYEFQSWADFESGGRPASAVEFEYHPDRNPGLSEQTKRIVEECWNAELEHEPRLFDSPAVTLLEVTDGAIHTGPARFRQHVIRRLVLSGDRYDVPASARAELRESVRLLSLMTAVVTSDDELLVGVKQTDGTDTRFLSLPGSGYLDRDEDLIGGRFRPTRAVIKREIQEELALVDLGEIRCLGVFEDCHHDSHLNPALFSVVSTPTSTATICSDAAEAVDADEFVTLTTIPIDKRLIGALLEAGIGQKPELFEESVPELEGPVSGLSHKTVLLLSLLGRLRFGMEWFRTRCKHRDAVHISKTN